MEGTLTISCDQSSSLRTIVFDAVPSVNEQISASITRVPIVTFRADQAFAFDAGTTSDLSFTIIRTERPDATDASNDSRYWTNAKFEEMLVNYIDRWQAETDGCTIDFEPVTSGQSVIRQNVFLSNLSIRCDKGIPETLYINLNANIGTMTARVKHPSIPDAPAKGYGSKVKEEEALVTMSSSNSFDHYVLYYGLQPEWSCVSSYSVKCGPEHPFPVLNLSLSKKNLSAIAPNLVEDIIPGKNRIFVNGIGGGEYIVTKTSSSGQNYKITAYSIYEQYRAAPIRNNISFGYDGSQSQNTTPFQLIQNILTNYSDYGAVETKVSFPLKDIYFCFKNINNTWDTDYGTFPAAIDAWYVLNVCALRLGCKIWFADNKAYIVDTSATPDSNYQDGRPTSDYQYNCYFQDIRDLYVNMDKYEPETPTADEIAFTQSVCGDIELGDEGSDVLKNYTVVQYGSDNDTTTGSPTADVSKSRDKFGYRKEEYSIREIGAGDAAIIANNTNERYCDSEQSICFKLAETHFGDTSQGEEAGKYWQPYFSQLTRVETIYDYSKDLVISNVPNFTGTGVSPHMYGKLTLSTAEYFFPQGYTEYWFGIVCPTDLTQNTSVINNIIYNG